MDRLIALFCALFLAAPALAQTPQTLPNFTPAFSPLTANNLFYCDQSLSTRACTTQQIADFVYATPPLIVTYFTVSATILNVTGPITAGSLSLVTPLPVNSGGTGAGAPVAIAALPICSSTTAGVRAVVNNGVTPPTYWGAVSTTGAGVDSVFCYYNGSAYSWVYN